MYNITMTHPLAGRKQSPEHIAKRMESFKKTGIPLRAMRPKLLSKINKTANGCWEWTGAVFKKNTGSYGQLRVGRRGNTKMVRAHRASYEEFIGKIPDGLVIDHLCQNTLCINPEHLEAVPQLVNMQRGRNSTKTHCVNGHEYTEINTFINSRGSRECKTCRAIHRKKDTA